MEEKVFCNGQERKKFNEKSNTYKTSGCQARKSPSKEKVELFPCEQSEQASFVTEFLTLFQMRRQK